MVQILRQSSVGKDSIRHREAEGWTAESVVTITADKHLNGPMDRAN